MTKEELLKEMIGEYRRKIVTYEAMIQEWEAEIGIQSKGKPGTISLGTNGNNLSASEPAALVKGMQFFNKSQPDAAKALLEIVGYPLRTNDIIDGIERGGVTVGGKTAKAKKTNLYTILHRSDDFGLVRKDTWGLTTWAGVKKEKDAKESSVEAGDETNA